MLLAEDDMYVRKLTQKVLEEAGYKVIVAVDGNDAIEKFNHNKEYIQLLLFDMIMPKKNGKESFKHIRKIKPDVKCIFLSGHAEEFFNKRTTEKEFCFISKPILPGNLLRTVRKVLDNESKIMTDIVS